MQAMVRDSMPFFILVGFILIFIMLVTLERIRKADELRYRSRARAPEAP
jgi:hypothetical protein